MALVGTLDESTYDKHDPWSPAVYTGDTGTANNSIIIETIDVSRFDTFLLKSSVGAMDVFVNLGDGNFVGPISIADLGATANDPVIVTAALRLYGFRGAYRTIRVRQNGSTNVSGAVLRAQRHN